METYFTHLAQQEHERGLVCDVYTRDNAPSIALSSRLHLKTSCPHFLLNTAKKNVTDSLIRHINMHSFLQPQFKV